MASQTIIDKFTTEDEIQDYDAAERTGIMANSSGMFDPSCNHAIKMSFSNRVDRRIEPNYAKKTTMINLMAKKQRASKPKNVPLSKLDSLMASKK